MGPTWALADLGTHGIPETRFPTQQGKAGSSSYWKNQIVALETLAQLSYRKTLGSKTFSRNEELEEVTSDTAPRGLGRQVHRKCVCFTRMKSWVWTPRTQIKGQAWWQMPVTPSLSRWETEGNDLWKSVGHLAWHAEFQANKIPVTN